MKEYKLLKAAKIVFLVLAWLSLVFGFIGGISIMIAGGSVDLAMPDAQPIPGYLGIIPIVQGVLGFFVLFVLSRMIAAILDIKDCCSKQTV
jgi:hypothetical protein